MARQSKIVTEINIAKNNGTLKEPFTVSDVNYACKNILAKSQSFLSKHRKGNPGNYKVYFMQVKKGKYFTI